MACPTSITKSAQPWSVTVCIRSDGTITIEPGTASYCDVEITVHREVTADELQAACDALAAVVKSPAEEQPDDPRLERPLWPRPASRARGSQTTQTGDKTHSATAERTCDRLQESKGED